MSMSPEMVRLVGSYENGCCIGVRGETVSEEKDVEGVFLCIKNVCLLTSLNFGISSRIEKILKILVLKKNFFLITGSFL